MKALLLILVAGAVSLEALAQAPDSLSFQGCLTDAVGDPLPDGVYEVAFGLYPDAVGGTSVWAEKQSVITDGCTFHTYLGGVVSLKNVPFDERLWLEIDVEGDGAIAPRTPLASAPYALSMRGMRAVPFDDGTFRSINLVGGWTDNVIHYSAYGATICGGGYSYGSTSHPNYVAGSLSTICGGSSNTAGGIASTIGGGTENHTGSTYATVCGGSTNDADGNSSTVCGGSGNQALGSWTTVAGGRENIAGDTGVQFASVLGGELNEALGYASTIPGGTHNVAEGDYSFAAGYGARALHEGTFVFGDRSDTAPTHYFESTGDNQFLIQAAGGVGIGTSEPFAGLHLQKDDLAVGAGAKHYDDFIIEAEDAVLGLYSSNSGSWGSAVTLSDMNAGATGVLNNKWGIIRQTSAGDDNLYFKFGTDDDQAQNDTKMYIGTDGHVHADAYDTPSGDVAEFFDVDGSEKYEPGDVLVIAPDGSKRLTPSNAPYSTLVAGVYATKPGVLLAKREVEDGYRVPVALVGVVPTKVSTENGVIRPGDLLVTSSTPGHAMRADESRLRFGTVLGKALEAFEGPGNGVIEILVSLR